MTCAVLEFHKKYANIFTGRTEKHYLSNSLQKRQTYLRHIDDIFIMWEHGREHLNYFIAVLNEIHSTTSVTFEY